MTTYLIDDISDKITESSMIQFGCRYIDENLMISDDSQADMIIQFSKINKMIKKRSPNIRQTIFDFTNLPTENFYPKKMNVIGNTNIAAHIDACTYYAYASEIYYKMKLLLLFAKYRIPETHYFDIEKTLISIENAVNEIIRTKPRIKKDIPKAILNTINSFRMKRKLCIASKLVPIPAEPYKNVNSVLEFEILFAGTLYHLSWMKSGNLFVKSAGEDSIIASLPDIDVLCENLMTEHKRAIIKSISDAC